MRSANQTAAGGKTSHATLPWGLGLLLLCATVAVLTFLRLHPLSPTSAQPQATTPTSVVTTTDPPTTTRAPLAAANWQPQPQKKTAKGAARLDSLDEKKAQALAKQGFAAVVLPTPKDYSTAEAERVLAVLKALKAKNVHRTIQLQPVADPQFFAAMAQWVGEGSFDAVLLEPTADAEALQTFDADLHLALQEAGLETLPVRYSLLATQMDQTDDPYVQWLQTTVGKNTNTSLLLLCDALPKKSLLEPWKALWQAGKAKLALALDLQTLLPKGNLDETLQFFAKLRALQPTEILLQDPAFAPKEEAAANLLQSYWQGELELAALDRPLELRRPLVAKPLKAKQSLTTNLPRLNVTGSCSPVHALTLNKENVPVSQSGDFAHDVKLEPGENRLVFGYRDKDYVLTVTYQAKVMDAVEPKGTLETTGGLALPVRVVALRGAKVHATLNGTRIALQPGAASEEDEDTLPEEDADFVPFVGSFKLPASGTKRKSLGKLVFSASANGFSESRNGATVVLLPAIAVTEPPTTVPATTTEPSTAPPESTTTALASSTENPTSAPTTSTVPPTEAPLVGLLSPREDHGLGRAVMAEVVGKYANSRWTSQTDDNSNPGCTPLPQGSFDYVTGQSGKYHLLASGKRIKSEDLALFEGYRLPANRLQAESRTANGWEIRLKTRWKAPLNLEMTGQKYDKNYGFSGHVWGLREFYATGLALQFYHCEGYSGGLDLNGSLFSNATWSQSGTTTTLQLTLAQSGRFYGWQMQYEGDVLVIRFKPKPPATLAGAVVWLDAGHGGKDPGSSLMAWHETLTQEKQLTLALTEKIRRKLEENGAQVVLTRSDDSYVSPGQRTERTRERAPDLFLSVHTDSAERASASGTTAFYYRGFSEPLAKAIHNRVVAVWRDEVYTPWSLVPDWERMRAEADRGTKYYPFEVTRVEECPAVLVEYGFGSNLEECRKLQQDEVQEALAQATVNGIADYLASR